MYSKNNWKKLKNKNHLFCKWAAKGLFHMRFFSLFFNFMCMSIQIYNNLLDLKQSNTREFKRRLFIWLVEIGIYNVTNFLNT